MSDPFYVHTSCVDTLSANGVPTPGRWSELRDRFNRYTALTRPAAERLAAEIVNPTPGADLTMVRAAALGEQAADSGDEAAVTARVRTAVHDKLIQLYAPVAQQNYAAVASRFDKAAGLFGKAARTCDPDIDSGDVIRLGERARAAWLSSEVVANELSELLPVLCAAAHLVGCDGSIAGLGAEGDVLRLPLGCDPGKSHRRRVWEAWQASGRCGRWAALHKLGAQLRAHSNPSRLQPYQEPKPFTARWVPGEYGGYQQEVLDPEDSPSTNYTEEAEWSIA